MKRSRTRRLGRLIASGAVMVCLAAAADPAGAQPENPVYLDDSPVAADTMRGVGALIERDNLGEAARVLQELLDQERDRVLPDPDRPGVSVSVRRLVMRRLMAEPELLERYRRLEEPRAAEMLAGRDWIEAARTRALTPSGLEATLRLGQTLLEDGAFLASARTLSELESRDDMTGPARDAGGALAASLTRYTDDPIALRLALAWNGAGWTRPDRIDPPPAAVERTRTAADAGRLGARASPVEAYEPGELPTDPIRSGALSAADPRSIDAPDPLEDLRPEDRASGRYFPWAMPAADENWIYTNDGVSVTRWDRYTLSPDWRVRIGPPAGQGSRDRWAEQTRRSAGQNLEDSGSVTLAGRRVFVASGMARAGAREDGGRLFALDRDTGRLLWAVEPDTLDDSLEGSSIRGPVLAGEGVVVVCLRKALRNRRLVSFSMVGLDPETGALRWTRTIASAGTLPYQQYGRVAGSAVLHRGVVYRADAVGVIAAVEAHSGRPLWVRRENPLPARNGRAGAPWASHAPIPIGGGQIVTLSPDRAELLRLDAQTGDVVLRIDARSIGSPDYLIALDALIAGVGGLGGGFYDPSDDRVWDSDALQGLVPTGRATAAGDRLIVPVTSGVAVVSPGDDEAIIEPLSITGNLLSLPDQLIAAGEFELHSYLSWSRARGQLERKMELFPDDPTAPTAYVSLAFHAGRTELIPKALDRAVDATVRSGASTLPLFELTLDMLRGSRDPASSRTVRDALVRRLGDLARTPDQRVTSQFELADLRLESGDAPGAVGALQDVLGDPELASARWFGGRLSLRADIEATRRVRNAVVRGGPESYARFERETRVRAERIDPTPDALVGLAQRFPMSTRAPGLWARAAEGARVAGDLHEAERALRESLRAARRLDEAGIDPDGPALIAVAGELAELLHARGRGPEAARMLRTLRLQHPALGVPDAPSFGIEAFRQPRAQLGRRLVREDAPALLPGVPLAPLLAPDTRTDRALLRSETLDRLTCVVVRPAGGLERAWEVALRGEPTVLHADTTGVLVHWITERGQELERLSSDDGASLWRAPLDVSRAPVPRIGERVLPRDTIATIGDGVVVVAGRGGGVSAFDLERGRPLWTSTAGLTEITDVHLSSNILVVAGVSGAGGGGGAPGGRVARLVVLDTRRGAVTAELEGISSEIRWVRATDRGLGDGGIVVGLGSAVASIDPARGEFEWIQRSGAALDSAGLFETHTGAFLLDSGQDLWRLDLRTGDLGSAPLERGRNDARSGPLWLRPIEGGVAVANPESIRLFDARGELRGSDAFDGQGRLLPPAIGAGVIAVVERRPDPLGALGEDWLHLLETDTGALLDSARLAGVTPPTTIHAIDGRLLLGVGDTTMVIKTE